MSGMGPSHKHEHRWFHPRLADLHQHFKSSYKQHMRSGSEQFSIAVLDMQALTFNKVAPMSLGRIDMSYRRVECKPPSDMNVIIDQNRGSGGWIRLQVKVCHVFRLPRELCRPFP